MSKAVVKTLQELVQTFFCQRLQIQQRVSGHTVASYRDTFAWPSSLFGKRPAGC